MPLTRLLTTNIKHDKNYASHVCRSLRLQRPGVVVFAIKYITAYRQRMKNSTLTSLQIANENRKTGLWLKKMTAQGLIGYDDYSKAAKHFKLHPDAAGWQKFIHHMFSLLGVILFICGLIFFMAWNWEDMHRFAKFGLLQGVFIVFGAWAALRWNRSWDARLALLGTSLMAGALLALYGQVYQTGANAWELFRAWAVVSAFIALAGQATAFWFIAWITSTLALSLYIVGSNWDWTYVVESSVLLKLAMVQFAFLIIAELAHALLAKLGTAFDPERWLRRSMGMLAIMLAGWQASMRVCLDIFGYEHLSGDIYLAYLLSLVVVFWYYYRRRPEFMFLALSILSSAAFIGTALSCLLLDINFEGSTFIVIAIIILGLTFGAVKLVLGLRKSLRAMGAWQNSNRHGHTEAPQKQDIQAETLAGWLDEAGITGREQSSDFFSKIRQAEDSAEPWYVKLFSIAGIWTGSTALLVFVFVMLGPSEMTCLVFALITCALSVWLGKSEAFTRRQMSHVLGLCSLALAVTSTGFDQIPALLFTMFILGVFWLLRPPLYNRAASFFIMLFCAHQLIYEIIYRMEYSSRAVLMNHHIIGLILYLSIFIISGLFAMYRLSHPPFKRKKSRSQITYAAALAIVVFIALKVLLADNLPGLIPYGLNLTPHNIGLVVLLAVVGIYSIKKRPDALPIIIIAAIALLPLAWFMPVVGMGLCLVFMAYYSGSIYTLSLSAVYLGFGLFMYYYNLDITLLYKSFLLMGTGLLMLAAGVFTNATINRVTGRRFV